LSGRGGKCSCSTCTIPTKEAHRPSQTNDPGQCTQYKRVLEIAGAEAQLANLIPPIINGKNFVQDPAAAVKFDKAEIKRRIEMPRGFTKAAGRDPSSVELSGIVMLTIARDKRVADAAVKATAAGIGFPNEEAVRKSPVLLVGTPDEVRRELRSRIEELGMTYYIYFRLRRRLARSWRAKLSRNSPPEGVASKRCAGDGPRLIAQFFKAAVKPARRRN
jgi:hypothetical protein